MPLYVLIVIFFESSFQEILVVLLLKVFLYAFLMLLANQGAALLLTNPSVVARHVFECAFDRQSRDKQRVSI